MQSFWGGGGSLKDHIESQGEGEVNIGQKRIAVFLSLLLEAGAELGQAQFKLELELSFTFNKIY